MTLCHVETQQPHFTALPEGFPDPGDLRVARALVQMARMLHGFVEVSNRRRGHEQRLAEHRARIRRDSRGGRRGRGRGPARRRAVLMAAAVAIISAAATRGPGDCGGRGCPQGSAMDASAG
jgi:hypothetical protein